MNTSSITTSTTHTTTPTTGTTTTAGPGSSTSHPATKPKLDNPVMIKAANDFALQLVKNQQLLIGWFKVAAKALQDKQWEVALLDNFITSKANNGVADFDTTYAYVIQAQQKLPMYKMYYWSALYATKKHPADDPNAALVDGDPLAIVGSASKQEATNVSLAKLLLIDYTFNGLVLTWDTASGLNTTSGRLVFGLNNVSGKPRRTFAGTVTEADGTKYVYAGLQVDPASEAGKHAAGGSSPQTNADLAKLQYANQIINMVSQSLFMALNIGMMYKMGLEVKELKKTIAAKQAKGEDAEAEENRLEKVGESQAVNERAAEQQVDAAPDIAGPVERQSSSEFEEGSSDVSPFSSSDEIPPTPPPSEVSDIENTEDEQDAIDQTIDDEIGASDQSPNEAPGSDEDGSLSDGTDGLTTDAEEFLGDAL